MSPTGSLLRGFRPSLHWVFQHIRGTNDRDYVTKEDLRVILRGEVDTNDLDEAFDRLDSDGNGRITEDEFMNGFATFLVEASAARQQKDDDDFDTNIGGHVFRQRSSTIRGSRRKNVKQVYESGTNNEDRPSEEFKKSLHHLSLHNRLSIQDLWKSLNESNPDAVSDFEDFVAEMASEVSSAQNALKKQKEANRLDAMELDVEIAMMHDETRAKLKEQSEILREKAETKIEQQLKEKDLELGEIKDKLQLLENELSASRHNQVELKTKYEESIQERKDLLARLTSSEDMLVDSAATIDRLRNETNKHRVEQESYLQQHKENITDLKMAYTSEITELREQIKVLQFNQSKHMHNGHNGHHGNMPTTPDLLTTHHESLGRVSPSSLLDEIVETEGGTSPVLKNTMILYSSTPVDQNDLDHLDLASKPSSNNNPVVMRSKSKKPNTRPTSMYCDKVENMDLDWPPGNWQETRQEWLAQVASSANITTSPVHSFTPIKPQRSIKSKKSENNNNHVKKETSTHSHVINTSPLLTKEVMPVKYFNDPVKCKPLEFVESYVVKSHQTFKILVVGNPHVGKSCFLMRLCTNTFTSRYASTIGVDFFSRAIQLNDKIISLQLWDTAGQERFQSVTRAYYRGANGVILMYDISREDSFIAVKSWINSIQDNMEEPPAALLLVGNKADLDDNNQREVLTETGETFAKIYGAMFSEVSAKSGYNVGNACLQLVEKLIDELGYSDSNKHGVNILNSSNKSKCSC